MSPLIRTQSAILLFIVAAVAGCLDGSAGNKPKPTVDAGGYDLDLGKFGNWKMHSDKPSGLVILDKTDEQEDGPTRGARLCTIRITLPVELRKETKENIAKEFCDGPDSFVQKKLFPEPIRKNWKRYADVQVGTRRAINYGGNDELSNQTSFVSATIVRVVQRGSAYVWFPESFSSDGSFFIVTGFETVVTPPAVSSDLPALETLLAAIIPR